MTARNCLPRWLAALALSLLLAACGGGGGGGSVPAPAPATPSSTTSTPAPAVGSVSASVDAAANVLAMVVDRGVNGSAINSPYVTVTVCQPGTSVCQDIDHVLVDTGSTGLRLTAATAASLSLPGITANGAVLAECGHFASGYTWGAVRRADIRLASRTASNVPVQVIGDPGVPAVPASCSGTGGSLDPAGAAKGILGVGLFTQDCGTFCEASTSPQIYFGCTAGGCTSARVATTSQVTNPVTLLATDNNGVVLVLPAVPVGGAARATGALILGIGTQTNNQLGAATVLTTDQRGFFRTVYNGTPYDQSFLDSGSNGFFFHDASLKTCAVSTEFFCPDAPLSLTATQVSSSGVSRDVSFTIESVDALSAQVAGANIAGSAGTALPQAFDWGLPFFYGRTVFTAITGANTPAGPGPYWAW
ncbi:DUF3443 domain-containing protein [Ramlibacter sp. MMS24-I3-19]|uniref:DUF3443 domain-containing protein n=1 Tax=Ramlibacter sp. MMS24-I3-19 TaxID=3416606 RepID=UPI003D017342